MITAVTGAVAGLDRDVQTEVGYYAAGLPVLILDKHGDDVVICLDDGFHPAGRCHTCCLPPDDLVPW